MKRRGFVPLFISLVAITVAARAGTPDFSKVPGSVVFHSPASSGNFIGSPGIVVLANGDYLATCDLFGPKSNESTSAVTKVFRSSDKGQTWSPVTDVQGMFWATLFSHQGKLYLMGTNKIFGDVVIARSDDDGKTWTSAKDRTTGLLREGKHACAPAAVVVHNGRIWRAVEDASKIGTPERFVAMMMSAPEDADLLQADSWTCSKGVGGNPNFYKGFVHWLEGNAVVTPNGKVVNLLRIDDVGGERAAMITIGDDGKSATFDPAADIIHFPGGTKKFTVRFDPQTKLYWSLTNYIPPQQMGGEPTRTRNTLALTSSPDLRNWTVNCIILYHPDPDKHAFQYVDWLFEGDDLIAVSRTAYDDEMGGAGNWHNANFLTFHRIKGFRNLSMKDSVPMPAIPAATFEFGDITVKGIRFEVASLNAGQKAFANRNYIWEQVSEKFRGWKFTRTSGGVKADITVTAKKDVTLHAATMPEPHGAKLDGWAPVEGAALQFNNAAHTRMNIYSREIKAGEELVVPGGTNWSGTLVLWPEK